MYLFYHWCKLWKGKNKKIMCTISYCTAMTLSSGGPYCGAVSAISGCTVLYSYLTICWWNWPGPDQTLVGCGCLAFVQVQRPVAFKLVIRLLLFMTILLQWVTTLKWGWVWAQGWAWHVIVVMVLVVVLSWSWGEWVGQGWVVMLCCHHGCHEVGEEWEGERVKGWKGDSDGNTLSSSWLLLLYCLHCCVTVVTSLSSYHQYCLQ